MTSEPNGSGAPTTERRTYSVAEASTILGCSKAHLYGMIERGELPGAIHLGAKIVIAKRAIDELL